MNKLASKSSKHLKKLIKSQIELSDSRQYYDFNLETHLQQHQIICCSMIRQSGTSTVVAELFNAEDDIYICDSPSSLRLFKQKLVTLGKIENENRYIKYFIFKADHGYISSKMYKSFDKKIRDIVQYQNEDARSLREQFIARGARVWFDIGNTIS